MITLKTTLMTPTSIAAIKRWKDSPMLDNLLMQPFVTHTLLSALWKDYVLPRPSSALRRLVVQSTCIVAGIASLNIRREGTVREARRVTEILGQGNCLDDDVEQHPLHAVKSKSESKSQIPYLIPIR